MRHLGISGGGTKIVGLFTAAQELHKYYAPDIISGISAGAILTMPLAMGKWEESAMLLNDLKLSSFFSQSPVNSRGKLTLKAYLNLFLGKSYLGKQDALRDRLEEVISVADFYYHIHRCPEMFVGTVDRRTGSRHYFHLNTLEYDQALDAICASAAIPIFTEGIYMDDMHLYDGGMRDHCPTSWMLTESIFSDNITQSISIYSRPENYRLRKKPLKPKNIIQVLEDYVSISNVEVSKMDEILERYVAKDRGIDHHIFYLPDILKSFYDVHPARLMELAQEGQLTVQNNLPDFLNQKQ